MSCRRPRQKVGAAAEQRIRDPERRVLAGLERRQPRLEPGDRRRVVPQAAARLVLHHLHHPLAQARAAPLTEGAAPFKIAKVAVGRPPELPRFPPPPPPRAPPPRGPAPRHPRARGGAGPPSP